MQSNHVVAAVQRCTSGGSSNRSILATVAPMASFAAQLIDVLYGLVDRLTGYGARGDEKAVAGSEEPTKLASAEAFRGEVVQIRSRETRVPGGSGAQVN